MKKVITLTFDADLLKGYSEVYTKHGVVNSDVVNCAGWVVDNFSWSIEQSYPETSPRGIEATKLRSLLYQQIIDQCTPQQLRDTKRLRKYMEHEY